jgi:hypothetical protein
MIHRIPAGHGDASASVARVTLGVSGTVVSELTRAPGVPCDPQLFRGTPGGGGNQLSAPTVEDLEDSGIFTPEQDPPRNGEAIKFLDADIGEFIKRPRTAVAREYEHKTQAALNTIMRFCAQNKNTVPDAATIIAYGDDFAAAVGDVAGISPQVRKGIDIILSPESPWLALAIAGIPMATQMIRNHQESIQQAQANFKSRPDRATRKAQKAEVKANRPRVHFKLGKREFSISMPVKIKLGFMMAQTVESDKLSDAVFHNEQVVKALRKRGINVAGYPM